MEYFSGLTPEKPRARSPGRGAKQVAMCGPYRHWSRRQRIEGQLKVARKRLAGEPLARAEQA